MPDRRALTFNSIDDVISEVRNLRNRLVHDSAETGPGPKPAYTLDEEDDDA